MGTMGFDPNMKRKTPPRKRKEIVYQAHFYGLIPGDVVRAIPEVLSALGLKFEETSTVIPGPMGPEEIPFVHHQDEDSNDIPFGSYNVDDFGTLQPSFVTRNYPPIISIQVSLQNAGLKAKWMELIEGIKKYAAANTIFKGRALKIGKAEDVLVPNTLDLSREVDVILNGNITDRLEASLFWPLANVRACKEHGIRTRRGIILEGHYGAGKSLVLYRAAQVAHEQGWTVLHCDANLISIAVGLTKMLGQTFVAIEDLDSATHGDRDRLNPILNSISSVATKTDGDYFIAVSTNFIDRIDPGLLRPERFDTLVKMDLPDDETIGRFLDKFENYIERPNGRIQEVVHAFRGCTPAIICEVQQLAKINTLRQNRPTTTDELLGLIAAMQRQKELAQPEYRTGDVKSQLADSLYRVTQGYN